MTTTTALLVNPVTGKVHSPDCEHATSCIPWVWPAKSASDRAEGEEE